MTVIVRMRHIRQAGMCGGRAVRDYIKARGWPWSRLLREGVPADELRHIDDALLQQVIAAADKEQSGGA